LIDLSSVVVLMHYRVVNVSSMASKSAIDRCSQQLQNELRACQTISDVSGFMSKFVT